MGIPSDEFQERIRKALGNPQLQKALRHTLSSFEPARRQAWASLPNAPQVRAEANAIRARTIAHLDRYLHQFQQQVEARGGKVYFAKTARDACEYVLALARQHGVRLVAKSKSMVSEEIELNEALQHAGIQVVETDLGEYLIQLAGERPSHIITPAIHKRRDEIAQILHQHLGMPLTDDIPTMTATARNALRQVFLEAEMGITGVNFGIAETGTLVFVSNEGNARMVSTLPRLHVALMGVERLVPTWEECELLLRVLARSATGQKLTVYTSFVSAPRSPDEADGPEELHVVLVDNGRLRWRGTPMEQALYCIRCGACLNVCPVYRAIGGHAYNSVYGGPIGSLVTPMLWGKERAELAFASTLCGACAEVCPVGIPIHDLLVRWRAMASHQLPKAERWGLKLFGWVVRSPRMWSLLKRWGTASLRRRANGGWIERGFGPFKGWTATRSLIAPEPITLRTSPAPHILAQDSPTPLREKQKAEPLKPSSESVQNPTPTGGHSSAILSAWQALGVQAQVITNAQVVDHLVHMLSTLKTATLSSSPLAQERQANCAPRVLIEEAVFQEWTHLAERLAQAGIECLPANADKHRKATAEVGVSLAIAGWADTGTLVIASGQARLRTASLLPPVALVLVPLSVVFPSARDWVCTLRERGALRSPSTMVAVTGPSRTADIEKVLTIGVHGPGTVHAWLIEDR